MSKLEKRRQTSAASVASADSTITELASADPAGSAPARSAPKAKTDTIVSWYQSREAELKAVSLIVALVIFELILEILMAACQLNASKAILRLSYAGLMFWLYYLGDTPKWLGRLLAGAFVIAGVLVVLNISGVLVRDRMSAPIKRAIKGEPPAAKAARLRQREAKQKAQLALIKAKKEAYQAVAKRAQTRKVVFNPTGRTGTGIALVLGDVVEIKNTTAACTVIGVKISPNETRSLTVDTSAGELAIYGSGKAGTLTFSVVPQLPS